ncbi:MAG: hypothetical protein O4805_07690, partial [Trichodesmium sp. St16_bin2-tuft]|nr:hypothetical protein [Trichodesmium sp. St16_bin2-tuft]
NPSFLLKQSVVIVIGSEMPVPTGKSKAPVVLTHKTSQVNELLIGWRVGFQPIRFQGRTRCQVVTSLLVHRNCDSGVSASNLRRVKN